MTVWKTYAAAGLVLIHQISKAYGIDFEEQLLSEGLDAVGSLAAIVFRLYGQVQAQLEVKKALYTPVPATVPTETVEALKADLTKFLAKL